MWDDVGTSPAFCGWCMPDAATISTRIDEAQSALHDIAVGKVTAYTTATGEQYTRHDMGHLRAYIRYLKGELLEAEAAASPGAAGDFGFQLTGIGRAS